MQQNMIARDQTSAGRGSYELNDKHSGARYGSEPTIPLTLIIDRGSSNAGSLNLAADPKSISFKIPCSFTTQLSSFRSR
ncbi:hypothetical protein OGAPHI_003216 [Ogataea philodendri]|uniref:Uncharacterized protein n=1 Tax=Ogataea philodendri TaxID=1378263 RepID=A0A9P8P7I1_9ASCO|nr:uncharacterized protein OGAPHI_003216 [Ogataea philodendri]KAH3666767.1 hypothetical protein OGAPHI_003216 [Ogataea philodendri]